MKPHKYHKSHETQRFTDMDGRRYFYLNFNYNNNKMPTIWQSKNRIRFGNGNPAFLDNKNPDGV